MRRLTYKNPRGDKVEFYLSPFLIESLEGIGEVEADNQDQSSPHQDGSTYIDTILEPRFIDMEGSIINRDFKTITKLRRHILNVCNPKLGLGEITLELDGSIQQISAIPEGTPTFPERGQNPWQDFQISWICPNPYWRSVNQESKPLQAYTGKFMLPMTFPFELGVSGSRTTLYNDGDVTAPVSIEIHGPTTNPQLFNRTTGEHIRINRTVADDEVLHIDTESGRQRIEVEFDNETTNAFGYLDHDSSTLSEFCLIIGENEIEHVADAGNRHAEVYIRWNDRFVGV